MFAFTLLLVMRLGNDCNQSWVFQVSTGRSGSTTLMEMINSLPNAYIAGENNGVFGALYQLHLDSERTHYKANLQQGAWWHHAIRQDTLNNLQRKYLAAAIGLNESSAYSIVGFKEIRWSGSAELDYLLYLFPRAKILINFRQNVSAQSTSGMNKHKDDRTSEMFTENNAMLREWAARHVTSTMVVPTELLTCAYINKVFRWLGFPHCKCMRVAHANKHNSFTPDAAHAQTICK